jgi:hypothetical protein
LSSSPPPYPLASSTCSVMAENCRRTRCCREPGQQCFEKNHLWAGCKYSCKPGIDPTDAVEHQSSWSCTTLGPRTPSSTEAHPAILGVPVRVLAPARRERADELVGNMVSHSHEASGMRLGGAPLVCFAAIVAVMGSAVGAGLMGWAWWRQVRSSTARSSSAWEELLGGAAAWERVRRGTSPSRALMGGSPNKATDDSPWAVPASEEFPTMPRASAHVRPGTEGRVGAACRAPRATLAPKDYRATMSQSPNVGSAQRTEQPYRGSAMHRSPRGLQARSRAEGLQQAVPSTSSPASFPVRQTLLRLFGI